MMTISEAFSSQRRNGEYVQPVAVRVNIQNAMAQAGVRDVTERANTPKFVVHAGGLAMKDMGLQDNLPYL